MVRRVPESRLEDLLACATRVFIAQGYRRTQMSDVAEALGVAKGTLYLYVESKQALFAATFVYADREAPALLAARAAPSRPPSRESWRAGCASGWPAQRFRAPSSRHSPASG